MCTQALLALPEAEVYCSVFQSVVVCCSVLRCGAVCCGVLQCVAVCCSVLVEDCVKHACVGLVHHLS